MFTEANNKTARTMKLAGVVAISAVFAGAGAAPALAADGDQFLREGTAITAKYKEHQAANPSGYIGAPTNYELCGVSGVGVTPAGATNPGSVQCSQTFEHGLITWNEINGAHIVKGAIYQDWAGNTTELRAGGYLGDAQPITDEIPMGNGVLQRFALADGGSGTYFWSPETGAHFIDDGTAAGQAYINMFLHNPNGVGFPTGQVVDVPEANQTRINLWYKGMPGHINAGFGPNGEVQIAAG